MQELEVEYFDGSTPEAHLAMAQFDTVGYRVNIKLASNNIVFHFDELKVDEVSEDFFILNIFLAFIKMISIKKMLLSHMIF